jgi:hypothetical protein
MAMLNLYFDVAEYPLADANKDKELAALRGVRKLSIGLVNGDWTQAMIAAGEIIDAVDVESCLAPNAKPEVIAACKADRKQLYALLAGVGQYAASYSQADPKSAAEARKAAIEAMMARMVRRSDRTSGAVLSLGGSFGLSGAYRGAFGARHGAFAGPFQLALGAGLDTYHPGKHDFGFHMEVSAFDLGQYVSFENKDFEVAEPDVRAAIAPGVKVGWRFASRETPVFVGPFFTVSPFVQTEDDEATWQVGGMIGVYIPFVSFN